MSTSSIRNRIVALREVRAADLVPHPKNWRRHPAFQRDVLQGLLAEVGYADALIAYREGEDLVVLDGHLRRSLDPDQLVPVLELDLSPIEAELVLATLDPVAALAKIDAGAVADLHTGIDASSEAVRELLVQIEHAASAGVAGGSTDPDAIPEDVPTRSRPGDVWTLGHHVILCADASVPETWDQLGASGIDAVWTDPPYGVDYAGRTQAGLKIANDRPGEIAALLTRTFDELDRVLGPGAALYVARPSTGGLGVAFGNAFSAHWQIVQELVWVKDRIVIGHADYHFQHELLLYGRKAGGGRRGRGAHGWYGGNAESSVFEIARPSVQADHPTAKPVELVRRCLSNSTVRGAMVADPFLGSGTTLMACEQLGRRCVGVEIDPRYVDVALARWEGFTGERAVRRGC
jgi:DNA modification methylase